LIATDVASRGLDFPSVSYVFNYDMPTNIDDYVHRIGRTGRCGNTGVAISFISEKNKPIIKDLYLLLDRLKQEIPAWFSEMYKKVKDEKTDNFMKYKNKSNNFSKDNFGFKKRDREDGNSGFGSNRGGYNNSYGNNNSSSGGYNSSNTYNKPANGHFGDRSAGGDSESYKRPSYSDNRVSSNPHNNGEFNNNNQGFNQGFSNSSVAEPGWVNHNNNDKPSTGISRDQKDNRDHKDHKDRHHSRERKRSRSRNRSRSNSRSRKEKKRSRSRDQSKDRYNNYKSNNTSSRGHNTNYESRR